MLSKTELFLGLSIIFACGWNFGNNLSYLIPTNDAWQGSWLKLIASLIMFVCFSMILYIDLNKNK